MLLRRPADAPACPDADLARIQAGHLAYPAELRDAGQVVTNGPVTDQPDLALRGLTFYRTGSHDLAGTWPGPTQPSAPGGSLLRS